MIEIVTHCYAERLPHYARTLCYQLSSLALHPPKTKVCITVCMMPDDKVTHNVTAWYKGMTRCRLDVPLLGFQYLTLPRLGRRAIGRNIAAKRTKADIVWFADVDQVFRDGILDRLADFDWPKGASMIYPRTIQISATHEIGKVQTDRLSDGPELIDVNPAEFVDKHYNRAIGGVQIVRGDTAREMGYLNNNKKYQTPCSEGKPFADFRDDLAFRSAAQIRGQIVGVDLPGMYRLRHTETTHT